MPCTINCLHPYRRDDVQLGPPWGPPIHRTMAVV